MPRNVILLHTDQQRYDSLGCCGDPSGTTPHIDALAAQGCIGRRHITANPVCEPSRASLFTGLYPQAHGVWGNGIALNREEMMNVNNSFAGLKPVVQPKTMADMFAESGYDTVALGKLHLTPNLAPEEYDYPECWEIMKRAEYDQWHGPYFGFRHVELTLGHGEQPCEGGHYGHWLAKNHPEVLKAIEDNHKNHQPQIPGVGDLIPSPVPSSIHNNAWLAERAAAYLEHDRPDDQPFFLFVGFPDPHHPITPSADILEALGELELNPPSDMQGEGLGWTPESLQRGQHLDLTAEQWKTIRRYTAAMIYQVDMAVGQIIQSVKQAGLWDDTVILFTSDHGDYMGDHSLLRKSYHADRSLVHVPFVLRVPESAEISLPEQFSQTMSNVDVMPTLAELAGIDIPQETQGRPLSEILEDEDACAYTYCYTGEAASANYSIFDQRYRLTWYPTHDRCVLFDHEQDPAEVHDLSHAPDHQALVERLLARLKDHALQSTNPIGARISPW